MDEALTNGAAVAELVQPDPANFAVEVAEAQGVVVTTAWPLPEVTAANIVVTSVAGGLLGAFLTWWVVLPVGVRAMPEVSVAVLVVLLYGTAFVVTVACVVGAVAWRFRGRLRSKVSLAAVGAGFVVGGLASVPLVMGFARMVNYSDWLPIMLAEASIAAGFGAAGVAVALRLARPGPRSWFRQRSQAAS